ncbi:hypothetical protein [Gillisia limnaea]|nr:hypothetical protein [Gillisia limnaea]
MINILYGILIILVAACLLILHRNNWKQKKFIKNELEDLKIIKEKNSNSF